jgi:hypothetical protein
MLTEEQLSERLRASLERELAAINPPEDLRERLRTEAMRPDRAVHGRSRRRRRPRAGDLLAALGTFVALGVAVLVIVLLGHARSTLTPGTHGASPPTLRLLKGDSLGNIEFGEPPSTLAAALKPLLGDPLSATRATPTGLVRSICGFSGQIEWRRPIASAGGRSIFDDLVAYFRNSRFVGYTYGEEWTPYGPRPALPPHHRALLTTPRGLTLEQPVTRARQLYGEAFVQTTQPQGTPPSAKLPRMPVWRVRTASGELFGGLTSPPRVAIVTINAGAVANTPCR